MDGGMSSHLTPYEVCERMIGGPDAIGAILEVHPKTPFSYRHASKGRDAGDLPSTRHQRKLLTWARAHDLPLTPEHLIFGADAAEIEALMRATDPAPAAQVAAE